MGYDMYWLQKSESEAAAVIEAREVLSEAADARDALPVGGEAHAAAQGVVDAAYAALRQTEVSYFRLNIFGMGRMCGLMERLGMGFWDEPHPDFPDAETYGVTWDDVDAVENPEFYPDTVLSPVTLEKVSDFQEERNRVLSWHGKADVPGIPLHKFGSNDGWIVLPVEAKAAADIWRKYVKEHGEQAANAVVESTGMSLDRWGEWIAYLDGSAVRGGFEVC